MPNCGIHAQSACANQVWRPASKLPIHSDSARTKSISDGDQCDPAGGGRAPTCRGPCQDAGDQRNQDEPEQNHKNITIATRNATAPPAIHAAYQRSLPVSVRLSTRQQRAARLGQAVVNGIDHIRFVHARDPHHRPHEEPVIEPVHSPIGEPQVDAALGPPGSRLSRRPAPDCADRQTRRARRPHRKASAAAALDKASVKPLAASGKRWERSRDEPFANGALSNPPTIDSSASTHDRNRHGESRPAADRSPHRPEEDEEDEAERVE